MINPITGYTYIDAVLSLVDKAKFYPSANGEWADCIWVDERARPSEAEVTTKLDELISIQPLYYLRIERDKRLLDCDLWGLQDYPTTEAQTTYRQALRDITNNYTSLEDVVWPIKPA
jgi:hypothetical protein